MSGRAQLVEDTARAMQKTAAERNPTWGGDDMWDDQPGYRQDDYRAMASAAIDAIVAFITRTPK